MQGSSFLLELLEFALQGDFWSNFWTNIIAGVVLSGFAWLGFRLTRTIRYILKATSRPYRITGIWIGTCKLPRHPPDVEAIEIYSLDKNEEHVTLTFFHYLPHIKKITKYEGAGIYRGEVLSAFYYIPEPQNAESGVFVLHKVGEKFKGVYAQYDLVANMKLHRSEENFVLRRVQISFWDQLKMMLGFPPFRCYQRAKDLYDKALTEQPDVIPQT